MNISLNRHLSRHTFLRGVGFAFSLILTHQCAMGEIPKPTDAPKPMTPDFTAVVVKGGGLWSQLDPAPEGA